MKLIDLLRMSSSSLFKRKVRTILTILGVVIGTASIVVMISLGLGLNKTSLEQIEQFGGLTTVTVREGGSGGVYYAVNSTGASGSSSSSASSAEVKHLDDSVVESIRQLPHVEVVSPVLDTSVVLRHGVYETSMSVTGMTEEGLRNMKIDLSEGELPKAGEGLKFLYGSAILENFYNSKTNASYWETGVLPDIDMMNDDIFVIFDTDAYYSSRSGSSGQTTGSSGDSTTKQPPKKYLIGAAGKIAASDTGYNQYSWNIYCEIEALEAQLKKVFKNKAIPGQPTNKNGKPYKQIYYTGIHVDVDAMDYVSEVQSAISDMGYIADSNVEWVQSMQNQYKSIQAVLAGIGAVSLFVAAIGIANTMMMSIYERTKEIGVIKVLGCSLSNIRSLFLLEAAYIGLIGGILGAMLSYAVSAIINSVAQSMDSYYTGISYIPAWLTLVAIGFATLVGIVSGFFPALRAMRLSPLAAIRNE